MSHSIAGEPFLLCTDGFKSAVNEAEIGAKEVQETIRRDTRAVVFEVDNESYGNGSRR